MGRKGTPFLNLQFMAQSVPQFVTMLRKSTRPRAEDPRLNVPFPTYNFALLPLPPSEHLNGHWT